MALEHKTVIGGLNITRNGDASLLVKLLIVDGLMEYLPDNHRFPITKGENLADKRVEINAVLAGMGRAPISNKDANVVGQTLTACWAAMDA
jgi:hypothetical protein